jgi:hypothetical protein
LDGFHGDECRQIQTEASKSFEEASDFLTGGIENAVFVLGIVEAVIEGSMRQGSRPVGWLPRIRQTCNAVDELWRSFRFERHRGISLQR